MASYVNMKHALCNCCFHSDEDVYEGGWINDMKHGSGMMTYNDGSIYEVSLNGLQSSA